MPTAIEVLYGEPDALRLTLATMTGTTITAFGSNVDFPIAIKVSPTFTGATSSSSKAAYFTTTAANGNKFSVPDNSKNINVMTGDEISDDSSSSASAKFDCSVVITAASRKQLIDLYESGSPVVAVRPIGRVSTTGAIAGYEYIIGSIADLKDNPQTGPSYMEFSVVGKTIGAGQNFELGTGIDFEDLNTAMTTSTLKSARDTVGLTIPALVETTNLDWSRLCSGKIVIKNS